jgi:enamine deaminase RidA (YjgF/YER057c/UK114 family)
MSKIAKRLAELGIALPHPVPPVASYVPTVIAGNLLTISGQLPMLSGTLHCRGQVGGTVTLEAAKAAAHLCFINVLAQANAALGGDLDRVARVVRLAGFIAATADFTDHAQVMNGASDLALAVFDEAGKHARSTVGVASLPLGATVEVEALFEID